MDLQAAIGAALASSQRPPQPTPGALFARGVTLVQVIAVTGGRIQWREADGRTTEGTIDDLAARALDRVPLTPVVGAFLDRAWGLARGRDLPAETRVGVLRRMMQRAPTPAEGAEVGRWIEALLHGREPVRTPPPGEPA
jgi:hypothetical protein